MKKIIRFFKKHICPYIDYILLVFCIIAIWMNKSCEILPIVTGWLGVAYILYILLLFFFKKTSFDWYMVNRGMLRKVICVSILVPFVVVVLIGIQCDPIQPNELISHVDKWDDTVKHKESNVLWTIFVHYVDPGLQVNAYQEGNARHWTGLIAILGLIFLNGLLITSIINWVDKRSERWLKGEVKYSGLLKCCLLKPHYVIIGGNDITVGVVKQILKEDETSKYTVCDQIIRLCWKPYILIQTTRDVEVYRRELFSDLTEDQQRRIIIYYGSRTSELDLKKLKIENAKEVYLLGENSREDDIESYHDTFNMRSLKLLLSLYKNTPKVKKIEALKKEIEATDAKIEETKDAQLKDDLKERKKILEANMEASLQKSRLLCRVMFEYQTSFSVFQFADIDCEISRYIDFRPFNYYEMWAQKVLINKKVGAESVQAERYLPLEGADGINKNSDKYVHLFIVGMSRMGVAMAIEAAHLAHYPNFEEKGIRTKITFIDKNAKEEKDFFIGRFQNLFALSHWRYGAVNESGNIEWKSTHTPTDIEYLGGDFLDIEWEFINAGIESQGMRDYILNVATNGAAKVTIAICLPESNRSHATALYLPKKLYELDSVLQVLVYNRYGESIVDAITKGEGLYPYCGKLRGFGYSADCFIDSHLKASEKIGVEINEIYNNISVEKQKYKPLKTSYKGKSATANMWSSIYNGNMIWTKLRCVDYQNKEFDDIEIIKTLADVEHNRWNVEELLMNFRPVTEQQQKDEKDCKNLHKNILKGQMIHLDICSNKKLLELDEDSREYDIEFSKKLHSLYTNPNVNL